MYMVIQKNMEKNRAFCVENRFDYGKDDIIKLPFLTKKIISGREREKIQDTQVPFSSFEHSARIMKSDGKEICRGYSREFVLLMNGKDALNMKCGNRPKNVESTEISERRKLLYNVGEKTGNSQLNVLKAHMSNIGMAEEDLNNPPDVWECLDFLENNFSDEELFLLLKIVYKNDGQLQKLLNDFTNGDTGGLTDKFPKQEVGDQNQTLQKPHTDWKGESMLHSYDPKFSNGITMIPDGSKMRSTKPEPSQLLVYDRGKHPGVGSLIDKFPMQEVGDQDQTNQNGPTHWIGESQLLFCDPRFSDSFTMIPDGSKMRSTKPEPSQLLVYDRGKHPGLCIIFNNKTFVNEVTHPTRHGTNKDRDLLEETLKKCGYEVFVYNDQSCSEILQTLEEFQSRYYRDYGALIVVTLSHGEQDVVFGSCGQIIAISSMTSLFRADKCPSLVGKPKIFIYQACQGRDLQKVNVWYRTHDSSQVDGDTLLMCENLEKTSKFPDSDQLHLAPVEADFLIVHSTMPGFASLRNENGSFFIQSLVKKIEEHSKREDLVSILAEVNRDVSQKIGVTSGDQFACQIPESKSRLTKKFYLQSVE